jgi:hypothetical protein
VKRKGLLIVLSLLVQSIIAWGQDGSFAGMANTSVMQFGIWSVNNNQAGLALIETPEIGACYQNRFKLSETGSQLLAVAFPTRTGNFALSYNRFGYNLYSENNVGLAYARNLGKYLSAGLQFDYLYYHQTENYGNRGAFLFEVGLIAKPVENLYIGAHIYNPGKARLADYNDERVPTVFRFGAGYHFSQLVLLAIETEKSIDTKARFKCGLEYQIVKNLFARTGFASEPNEFSLGLGYAFKNLAADVAFSSHQYLPMSTQVALKYSF